MAVDLLSKLNDLQMKPNINTDYERYTTELISHYIMGVGATFLCCTGTIGNTLSLLVLSKRSMRNTTTNYYLISLAISDTLVLIFTLITLLKDIPRPHPNTPLYLVWKNDKTMLESYRVSQAFSIMFQVCSIWIIVAFTVDRFIMICHPFMAERYCSLARARYIILSIVLASVVYCIPRFFEYEIKPIEYPLMEKNTTILLAWTELSDFGKSTVFKEVYHFWSWVILVVTIPLISIAIMNIFLILEVRAAVLRGRLINASERGRQDTNVMLIGVIVIFLICQLPAAVSHVLWGLKNITVPKFSMSYFVFNEVANLLVVLNSAINIVPYYFFGRKFRQHFLNSFCPRVLVSNEHIQRLSLHSLHLKHFDTCVENHSPNAAEDGQNKGNRTSIVAMKRSSLLPDKSISRLRHIGKSQSLSPLNPTLDNGCEKQLLKSNSQILNDTEKLTLSFDESVSETKVVNGVSINGAVRLK